MPLHVVTLPVMYHTSIVTPTGPTEPQSTADMDTDEKTHADHDERVSSEKHDVTASVTDSDHHVVLGAILKTHPINTWGSGSLHLYAICLLVYLCSTMNGSLKSQANVTIHN